MQSICNKEVHILKIYLKIIVISLLALSCKSANKSKLRINDTSNVFVEVVDGTSTDSVKMNISTTESAPVTLCIVAIDAKCEGSTLKVAYKAPIKAGDRYIRIGDREVPASSSKDYLVLNASNTVLLRYRLKDKTDVDVSVDITGVDTLSDGTTPRSRTGALLSKEYVLTCLHNHQNQKMQDNLPEAKWWIHPKGAELPLFRSPMSVHSNGSEDIVVIGQEHFPELDLALLKIRWPAGTPVGQTFPDAIAIGSYVPKTGVTVTSRGFPRAKYMPGKKATDHTGSFLKAESGQMTYKDMDIGLGDSGSPVLAKDIL